MGKEHFIEVINVDTYTYICNNIVRIYVFSLSTIHSNSLSTIDNTNLPSDNKSGATEVGWPFLAGVRYGLNYGNGNSFLK